MATHVRPQHIQAQLPSFSQDFAVIHIGDRFDLSAIQNLYNNVPLDVFVKDGSRCKSITRCTVNDDIVAFSSHHEPLYQKEIWNKGVYGAAKRSYPQMEKSLAELFKPAFSIFDSCANLAPHHEILGQAQWVTTGNDLREAITSREGWHQDGATVLGILIVNRVNITGGISMLVRNEYGENPEFSQILEPGSLCSSTIASFGTFRQTSGRRILVLRPAEIF